MSNKSLLYTVFFLLTMTIAAQEQVTKSAKDSVAKTPVNEVVKDSVVKTPVAAVVKDSVAPAPITTVVKDSVAQAPVIAVVKDSVAQAPVSTPVVEKKVPTGPFKKLKIDGVAAVIGENVILDSDVDIAYKQIISEGASAADVSRCELAGSLFETKLYAHHAVQDSIEIRDVEVNGLVDQQIAYMTNQLGTMDKVLAFYKKDNLADFRKELFEVNKSNSLSEKMRNKIISGIQITPEEVREFFDKIPVKDRPLFGTEIELAQIMIEPKTTAQEEQDVIDRLNQYRADVVENGSSFATKAVLYSQDPGSKSKGGKYTLDRKTNFAKEFKDVAFSLQEEEVSEPFKTDFGWHIIKLDKIRGEEIDVRHILLVPEISRTSVESAYKKIDSIRTAISSGSIAFKEAARKFSDEKETKEDGGQLINPTTGDTHFELTKIDPILYDQVSKLKENEVSLVIPDQDRQGKKKFKLITVLKRYDEHIADYAKDYIKIQELALRKKQIDAIREWQDEKILDTYIKINGEYRACNYSGNWVKN